MCLETFEAGEDADDSFVPLQRIRRVANERGARDEVVDTQRRTETNHPSRRQDVRRSGDIVASRFRRQGPQEYCTGVPYAVRHRLGGLDVQAEVLRCDVIRHAREGVAVGDDERAPVATERLARDRCAGQIRELRLELRVDAGDELLGETDEERIRVFVVLGLREEIGGD